ncbi:hypothetical protein D3C85_1557050 [compost metagenome]
MIGAAWLDEVVGGPRLNRIDSGVHGRVGSDDHHAHPRCLDAHLRQNIQAIVLTQAQIKEAQIEHLTLQQGIGLGRAGRGGDAIAFVFQAIAEGSQDSGLIVHQQNAALMHSG